MSTSSTNKLLEGLNADHAAVGPVVLEFHAAGDLGENGVVLPEPRVEARSEATATLTHDDRAARHDVPVVRYHAQALRVGVAAVAGTALSFFMSHSSEPSAIRYRFS